ncbi:MAG: dolichyl-phosphate beta-glucosyltransferase [Dehalococcoidales bacterium]
MSANSEIYLSIIIPAYNKESTIEKALTRIAEFLSEQDYNWEVIVVDDASTDSTVAKVNQFMNQHGGISVKLLVNEQNRQKGASIRSGVLEAKGKYSIYLDADYAYPIDQIDNFLNQLENGVGIVIGNRTDPNTTFLVKPAAFNYIYQRHLLGRIFNWLVRLLLLSNIRDTQCGIKGFQTVTARAILSRMRIFNFAFDVEMLYIARQNGEKIVQIPVTYDYIDEPSSVRLFRHSLVMFKSLVQIKFNAWRKRYVINASPDGPSKHGEGN